MFSINYSELKGCQPEFLKNHFWAERDFSRYGSPPSHYAKKQEQSTYLAKAWEKGKTVFFSGFNITYVALSSLSPLSSLCLL